MKRLMRLPFFQQMFCAVSLVVLSASAAARQTAPPGQSPAAATPEPNSATGPASPAPPANAVIKPPPTAAPMQPDRRQARAKTSEEAAAYQKIVAEKKPDEQIHLIEDFLLQYPDSELKEYVFEQAMADYQAKRDSDHLVTYGELTLAQNPDNLTALLVLATAIAETTNRDDPDRDDKLDDGDEHAAHALELLETLRKPPGFPDQQWETTKREAQSNAHAARGLIALIREQFSAAEAELKQAVDLAPRPDAVLLYRLGLSYSFDKKYQEAVEVLDRAEALGGVKFASGGNARDLVIEAKEFANKGLAAAATAAGPADASPRSAEPDANQPQSSP